MARGVRLARGLPVGGMVNRHLSVFLPYDRPPQHEDQLTRAAMIVMRAVPLARDALLARLGAPTSARLPEPELDMQTSYVMAAPLLAEPDGLALQELISVFLSPDERLNLPEAEVTERAEGQRLDGVLRFGDQLVVVIECKVVPHALTRQAEELQRHGVTIGKTKVVSLGWHEVLEDWWALLEHGLLAPAERVLVEDLVAFTEEHFPHLLPFTTLGRAGEHGLRRQRRLVALLREATGIAEAGPARGSPAAAEVMLDAAISTTATQRMALLDQDGTLALCAWPAELKPQAAALYRTSRAQQLAAFLAAHPDTWQARPTVHLAFRNATPGQRLYLHCQLGITDYIDRWSEEDFEQVGTHHPDGIRGSLWPWLRERHYAGPEDDQYLDAFLSRLGRRDAHLRPGLELGHTWPWAQAVDLDERRALASQIRTAAADLLAALGEPPLPTDAKSDRTAPPR